MSDQEDLPQPGTTEAQAMGCNCMLRDGEGGFIDPRWPQWITVQCPLHGAGAKHPLHNHKSTL